MVDEELTSIQYEIQCLFAWHLEDVMIWTERPPKVLSATNTGITQAKAPRILFPKVYKNRKASASA